MVFGEVKKCQNIDISLHILWFRL